MRRCGIVPVGVVWLLAFFGSAFAGPAGVPGNYMRVFGLAHPPYGFVNLCKRTPRECAQGRREEHRFDATPDRFAELDAVNRAVNREIEPITDIEHYGEADRWTIPRLRGDCEDYVLLKRRRLIALGWPQSALLITVVRDELGDGHAVLTARTRQGDFILDNKTNEIKIWHRVRYQFVMRQSSLNPRVWMSLGPQERSPSLPLAGVRHDR